MRTEQKEIKRWIHDVLRDPSSNFLSKSPRPLEKKVAPRLRTVLHGRNSPYSPCCVQGGLSMTNRSISLGTLQSFAAWVLTGVDPVNRRKSAKQSELFGGFPFSTFVAEIEMNPSSWQLRAQIAPSLAVDIEARSGSPEDYDDRNGYLADFLGEDSDFLVPLPLPKDKGDLVQVERAPKERLFELRYQNFSVIMSRSRRFCCLTSVNIPLLPDH
jgi:hypothetical protein